MLRNIASQKYRVFAWDSATGLPKTGDAANISAYITKDDGTPAATNDAAPTEVSSTNEPGYYDFDLTQAESNAAKVSLSPKSSTSGIVVVACPPVVYTRPQYFSLRSVDSSGKAAATLAAADVSGNLPANVIQWGGTAVASANVLIDGAITAAKIASDAVTSAKIADGAFTAAKFANGAFDAVWSVGTRTLTAATNISSGIAAAVWEVATSGLTTAGSIGKLLVDNINATISSRLASSSYTAPPSASQNAAQVRTELATELGRLDQSLSQNEANIRGADSDTLKTLSDKIAALNDFDPANDTVAHVTLVDTCTTNTDMRGTDNAYTGTPPTAEAIRQEIDSNSTKLTDILADTNELQGDWANGGRLDLLIDSLVAAVVTAAGEPGQGDPPASASRMAKIDWLYKWARNKTEQTATERKHYNDGGTVVDQKATVSDDGTTFTRGKMGSGA